MNCVYCKVKIRGNAVQEHFIPRSLGGRGKKAGNIVNSCEDCDRIKTGLAFWSFESIGEYVSLVKKYDGCFPRFNYRVWIRNKLQKAIIDVEKRKLLSLALDDVTWAFKEANKNGGSK